MDEDFLLHIPIADPLEILRRRLRANLLCTLYGGFPPADLRRPLSRAFDFCLDNTNSRGSPLQEIRKTQQIIRSTPFRELLVSRTTVIC